MLSVCDVRGLGMLYGVGRLPDLWAHVLTHATGVGALGGYMATWQVGDTHDGSDPSSRSPWADCHGKTRVCFTDVSQRRHEARLG